ncbi:undecaprenyl diphosphate synthase [Alkaliphilus metalliredigens QYMF]|uniref:Isoprenyl transferase n=1 Tax=Alkaliphilus metalliredigens (strain QYMF) TaxID=293826 RepID=A6TRL8_ALKMQ|nr:isoprenyl transferase [Alkaliphilus metalliredigens]ABR48836.1 undecaprenyl diphosphate synthase [Alkaliphilus metalliredigens QYMF]
MKKELFSNALYEQVKSNDIPKHIAIIMDGNGRWAKKRKMPRAFGHRAGVEALRDVIRTASNVGVEYLTLYAFSTENWNRPPEEVSLLMKLLIEYLRKEVRELHENHVKITTIGDIESLPSEVRIEIGKAVKMTNENKGLSVNIALNYGSRDEMTRAVKSIASQLLANEISLEQISYDMIEKHLDTSNIPDPDLLIRTSGEHRLSNFLLWQLAYSEFYFTETYWPDFKGENLLQAINDFQNRERRFGGI